ncbi:hypothetical protein KAI36_01750 [Paenibacillus sp. S02]|nr:hypothetical protein KAI36_01750 [Paenibacillus sp. S02]
MRWIIEPKALQSSVVPAGFCWVDNKHGCIMYKS